MDENKDLEMDPEQYADAPKTGRPKWQIALAWLGIAIVLAGFLLYCWQIAHGGI